MTTTISSDDVEVKDESGIEVSVTAEELSAIGSHVNDATLKFMNNDFRKLLNSHAVASNFLKTAFGKLKKNNSIFNIEFKIFSNHLFSIFCKFKKRQT